MTRTQEHAAEVNGQTFINNSSVGIYPSIVPDCEAQALVALLGRATRLA